MAFESDSVISTNFTSMVSCGGGVFSKQDVLIDDGQVLQCGANYHLFRGGSLKTRLLPGTVKSTPALVKRRRASFSNSEPLGFTDICRALPGNGESTNLGGALLASLIAWSMLVVNASDKARLNVFASILNQRVWSAVGGLV